MPRTFSPICLALLVATSSLAMACGSSGQTADTHVATDVGAGGGGAGGEGVTGVGGRGGVSGTGGVAGRGGAAGIGGAAGQSGMSGSGGTGSAAGWAGSGGDGGGGAGSGGMETGGAGSGGMPPTPPPYPIVLCHGFFGFEHFAGVDFITYFYGVKDHLAAQGETSVFTPAVDPFNDSTTRGEQLTAKVQEILAQTGASKVNLIGHSQGGLDVRVVAHDHPEMVASVTTLATPHMGTPIADVALKVLSDPNQQALLDQLVKLVGIPLYDAAGNQTSLSKSMIQMSTEGMKIFNGKYTDVPGLLYQSIAGRSNMSHAFPDCDVSPELPFLGTYDQTLDPVNSLLSIPALICNGTDPAAIPNDGLIRVRDAKWGHFLGCVPADHFDEIGQLFGQNPGLGNDWTYLDFYSDVVKLLRAKGLLSRNPQQSGN